MNYSTTGLAYLSLFIVLSYLIYRFLKYFQVKITTTSKLFFLLILPFWILSGIRTAGGLFFSDDQTFLELTIDAATFLEAIGLAVGAYLIFYIKFPKISPWFGFFPILILGLVATFLTVNTSFKPFLESSGAVNWNIEASSFPLLFLRFFLFGIVFVSLIFIYKQSLKSSDLSVRKKAQRVIIFFLIGIGVITFNFIILKIFQLGTIWLDFGLVALSLLLFFSLITQEEPITISK